MSTLEVFKKPVLAKHSSFNSTKSHSLDDESKGLDSKDGDSVSIRERVFGEIDTDDVYEILSGEPLPDVSLLMPVETQTLTFRTVIVGYVVSFLVEHPFSLPSLTGFLLQMRSWRCRPSE